MSFCREGTTGGGVAGALKRTYLGAWVRGASNLNAHDPEDL